MRAGRIAGTVTGIAMLVALFLIPFGTIPGFIAHNSTLYSAFRNATTGLPQMQSAGNAEIAATFITIAAGILILIAGLLGAFPLGSGIIGILGMTVLTAGAYSTLGISSSSGMTFGPGYYIIWVASAAAFCFSFLLRGHGTESSGSLDDLETA